MGNFGGAGRRPGRGRRAGRSRRAAELVDVALRRECGEPVALGGHRPVRHRGSSWGMPPKMGSPRRAVRTRCPSSDTPHATDRNCTHRFAVSDGHVRVNPTRLAGFCAASGACAGSISGASPAGRVQTPWRPQASTDTRIVPAVNLFVRAGDGRPRLTHGAVSRPVVQVSEAVLCCVPQLWKGFVMSRGSDRRGCAERLL